jgi:hypothetical protein
MTTRTDPSTGNITGASGSMGGGVPNLTVEQRALAWCCDALADDLLPLMAKGKPWFTAYEVRQKPEFLASLVASGILTRHKSQSHDGHYYRTTHITRPFLLCALALRDERRRAMQERTTPSP